MLFLVVGKDGWFCWLRPLPFSCFGLQCISTLCLFFFFNVACVLHPICHELYRACRVQYIWLPWCSFFEGRPQQTSPISTISGRFEVATSKTDSALVAFKAERHDCWRECDLHPQPGFSTLFNHITLKSYEHLVVNFMFMMCRNWKRNINEYHGKSNVFQICFEIVVVKWC